MARQIIGIDCATVDSKVGLALAQYEQGNVHVQSVVTGPEHSILDTICAWLDAPYPTLLALDAPLGWPAVFGETLADHVAGQPLAVPPNRLFRRHTDRVIKAQVGRQPLDVGADRIARTAHAALTLLEQLRRRTGEAIPLSWQPEDIESIAAIEVYPTATLTMYAIQAAGYKKKEDVAARGKMVAQLARHVRLPDDRQIMVTRADALDAVVCVLAGADYLGGRAIQPPTDKLVRKEGWIWVRSAEGGRSPSER